MQDVWDGVKSERASPKAGVEVGSRWKRRRLLYAIEERTFLPSPFPLILLSLLSGLWSRLCSSDFGWLVSFFLVFSFTFSLSSSSDAPPSLLCCNLSVSTYFGF